MSTKRECFVTTSDNPFDYFTQFDDWLAFDSQKGYNTLQYVARIAKTSSSLSDEDNDLLLEQAIDEIVELNLLGLYKKVYND